VASVGRGGSVGAATSLVANRERETIYQCLYLAQSSDGTDIDQMMLALSTYMGHAEIFYTYWYLTAVPELMALAGGKFERFADLVGDSDE